MRLSRDQEVQKQRKGDQLTLLTRCIGGGDHVRAWSLPVQLGIAEREPGVQRVFREHRTPIIRPGLLTTSRDFHMTEFPFRPGFREYRRDRSINRNL